MKRRYGIIVAAIIMLMVSGVLLINKSSYAEPYVEDFCAYRIYFITSNEEEVYAKNDYNRIDLPSNRFYTNVMDFSSSENDYRLFVATNYLFGKYVHLNDDASTGNNLSSAEVAIYDSKSNEVYRY